MGWKNVKEHYGIGHIVQVTDKGICIGSPYIHDIILIGLDGEVKKRYAADGWGKNKDLIRYQGAMDADPDTLRYLIDKPDTFKVSLPVYTYDGAEIIEEACEEYGWPNVTHAGHIQYENHFSADRAQVIAWAKKDARSAIQWTRERLDDERAKLAEGEDRLRRFEGNLAALLAAYPDPEPAK